MKLVTYSTGINARLGALINEHVIDLTVPNMPASMLDLIKAGPEAWLAIADQLPASHAAALPLSSIKLLAPLPNPSKIIAIGLNYLDHCREQNVPVPERPLMFAKYAAAISGPDEDIVWDPALTQQVDYEVELAVVIGRRARHVSEAEALKHVFGYTIINDVSARDLQFADGQWVRAKSLDTFCPMGPVIVTADEIPDPQVLPIRCLVNGQPLQDSSTSEMVFSVCQLISSLSRSFTLEPGDVITTGTPNGVGVFRTPPIFLHDGDKVVAEIDGIGQLCNRVRILENEAFFEAQSSYEL